MRKNVDTLSISSFSFLVLRWDGYLFLVSLLYSEDSHLLVHFLGLKNWPGLVVQCQLLVLWTNMNLAS